MEVFVVGETFKLALRGRVVVEAGQDESGLIHPPGGGPWVSWTRLFMRKKTEV